MYQSVQKEGERYEGLSTQGFGVEDYPPREDDPPTNHHGAKPRSTVFAQMT